MERRVDDFFGRAVAVSMDEAFARRAKVLSEQNPQSDAGVPPLACNLCTKEELHKN